MNPLSAAIGLPSAAPRQPAVRPASAAPHDDRPDGGSDAALLALQAGLAMVQPRMPDVPGPAGEASLPAPALDVSQMHKPAPAPLAQELAWSDMAMQQPLEARAAMLLPASLMARFDHRRDEAARGNSLEDERGILAHASSQLRQAASAPVPVGLAMLAHARLARTGEPEMAMDANSTIAGRATAVNHAAAKAVPVLSHRSGVAPSDTSPEQGVRAAGQDTPAIATSVAQAPAGGIASAKPLAKDMGAAPERRLLDALGERITVQAQQGVQSAVVRLDPQLAGSVLIELRHEAGALHVRISASQADVAQQLRSISDGLRHELNNRQFGDVTVQVSHERQGGQGGRGGHPQEHGGEPQRQQPGRAIDTAAAGTFDAEWHRMQSLRNNNV